MNKGPYCHCGSSTVFRIDYPVQMRRPGAQRLLRTDFSLEEMTRAGSIFIAHTLALGDYIVYTVSHIWYLISQHPRDRAVRNKHACAGKYENRCRLLGLRLCKFSCIQVHTSEMFVDVSVSAATGNRRNSVLVSTRAQWQV